METGAKPLKKLKCMAGFFAVAKIKRKAARGRLFALGGYYFEDGARFNTPFS